jgi:hypothetical protein
MRRLGLAMIVTCLVLGASGVTTLVFAERCAGPESSGLAQRDCQPTCVTCGCCAQAVEPGVFQTTRSGQPTATDVEPLISRIPARHFQDILHVPKPRFV